MGNVVSAFAAAASRIRTWRQDPLSFVRDNFKVEPDEWQKDALIKLGGPRKTRRRLGLKACTGPGKSTVLAWEGWHRLSCFAEKGEHPKGAAISITDKNLKDNLWPELSKWQSRSEFLKHAFTWTKEKIYANDHPETWFLSARSFAKDADAEAIGRALSGLHSRFPFVLLDETGDMPLPVGRAAEQIFTGDVADALILAAGNPTSTSGLLYEISSSRGGWDIITITADPDDPKRTPRVSIEHAREQIEKYGRDNAWVMATILGLFPKGGFNTLLTLDQVEAAMVRALRMEDFDWSQKRLGVDVARFGDDRTVIFPRQGLCGFSPVELRNSDSLQVAARVAMAKMRWQSELEFVDGTGGWGAGVVDALRAAGHTPLEVNASGKAQDAQYFNVRSECWFRMADWVKGGGALPKMRDLIPELTAVQYSYQGGKFRLEEKDQVKKRLGFSPDYADALAQTFYLPEMPRSTRMANGIEIPFAVEGQGSRNSNDYDPLDPKRQ